MARIYRMSPEQNTEWEQGGISAQHVEAAIETDLEEDLNTEDVEVLLDDGSVAFTLWWPEA